MTDTPYKDDLHHYLKVGRDALLWKLDDLSDYDVRRPLVPSGTNLLGLLKHVTYVEVSGSTRPSRAAPALRSASRPRRIVPSA